MNTIHLIESRKGNLYLFSYRGRSLSFVHPKMSHIIRQMFKDEYKTGKSRKYYERKVAYLKKHGLFNNETFEHKIVKFDRSQVRDSLIHVGQIIFEVTNSCNLKCKYCCFNDLYEESSLINKQGKLGFETAKKLLDYLMELWGDTLCSKEVDIAFYGGEPLLNYSFIKKVLNYTEHLKSDRLRFTYSMTTNGLLLDKYLDDLVNKNFKILVSLDGDFDASVYRVGEDRRDLYDKIINNLDLYKNKYPLHFERNVDFNVVIHRKNDIQSVFSFIKKKYGKTPRFSPLSTRNVKESQKETFKTMYRKMPDDLIEGKDLDAITENLHPYTSGFMEMVKFANALLDIQYQTYNDLFVNTGLNDIVYTPSGTCWPYSRKFFLSTNGDILACEKISHRNVLGNVDNNSVNIDYINIADIYNEKIYSSFSDCKKCYRLPYCPVCFFDSLLGDRSCLAFEDENKFTENLKRKIDYLELNPIQVNEILKIKVQ